MTGIEERLETLIASAPPEPPPPEMVSIGNCSDCDKEVEAGKDVPIPEVIFCYDCNHRRNDGLKMWESITPPLYRQTDLEHTAFNRRLHARVKDLSPGESRQGVGLYGRSGGSKTRVAYLMLKQEAMKGYSVAAVTASQFARIVQNQFDDCVTSRGFGSRQSGKAHFQREFVRWQKCDVLLFDDVGKVPRWTDRLESDFFELVEHRTSHLKPIIWTANASLEQLKLSEDGAAAITRRLIEFSNPVIRVT